eukprot:6460989-Amphidinium_carterae.1
MGITSMYRDVARMRHYFETALFRVHIDGEAHHYRFLFATLLPIRISFLKVLAEPLVMPDLQPCEYMDYLADTPMHHWRFTNVQVTCEDFFAGLAEDGIVEVCMQTFFKGQRQLASYGEYMGLRQLLEGLHRELNRHKEPRNTHKVASAGSKNHEESDDSAQSSVCESGSHVDDEEAAEDVSETSVPVRGARGSADHDETEYDKVFSE